MCTRLTANRLRFVRLLVCLCVAAASMLCMDARDALAYDFIDIDRFVDTPRGSTASDSELSSFSNYGTQPWRDYEYQTSYSSALSGTTTTTLPSITISTIAGSRPISINQLGISTSPVPSSSSTGYTGTDILLGTPTGTAGSWSVTTSTIAGSIRLRAYYGNSFFIRDAGSSGSKITGTIGSGSDASYTHEATVPSLSEATISTVGAVRRDYRAKDYLYTGEQSGTWYFSVTFASYYSGLIRQGEKFRVTGNYSPLYTINEAGSITGTLSSPSLEKFVVRYSDNSYGVIGRASEVTLGQGIQVLTLVYRVTGSTPYGILWALPNVMVTDNSQQQIIHEVYTQGQGTQSTIVQQTQQQTQELKDTTGSGSIVSGLTNGGVEGFEQNLGLLGQMSAITTQFQQALLVSDSSSLVPFPGINVLGVTIVPAQDVDLLQYGLDSILTPCKVILNFLMVAAWLRGMKYVLDVQVLGMDSKGE